MVANIYGKVPHKQQEQNTNQAGLAKAGAETPALVVSDLQSLFCEVGCHQGVAVPWLCLLVSPGDFPQMGLTVGLGSCLPNSWVSLKWKVGLLSQPTSWLLSFFVTFYFPVWGPTLSLGSRQYNYHTLSSNLCVARNTEILKEVARGFTYTGTQPPMIERLNINCFDLKLQVAMKSRGLPIPWKEVGLHFKKADELWKGRDFLMKLNF